MNQRNMVTGVVVGLLVGFIGDILLAKTGVSV